MPQECIAVIDLGTVTFHLLIIELSDLHHFTIREKYKEFVRIGEKGLTSGKIEPEAFERGMLALSNFRKMIDSRGVDKVLAFATSAVRSASNGADFVREACEKTGIVIRVIGGNEEAALIYTGIKYGLQLPAHDDALLMDIGGGSVEFIVGNRVSSKFLRSYNLGGQRLLEIIRPSDPINAAQIQETNALFKRELSGMIQELKEFKFSTMVGSSGTFDTLSLMLALEEDPAYPTANLNGYMLDIKRYKRLAKKLIGANRAERLAMNGMEPNRVDMIIMGVLLINFLIDELKLSRLQASSFALKEGIVFNYIEESREEDIPNQELRDRREQAVRSFGKRYDYAVTHVEHVSRLSLRLFDQLTLLHNYGGEERELLHYAALLHDIGHYVNRSGHHKHSQYIVQNSVLPGFSADELLLLSNLVRYHRKSLPSMEHLHYAILYKEHKERVCKLAGILRLCANLDRAYRGIVTDVEVKSRPEGITLIITSKEPALIEIESAKSALSLFEYAFNCKVEIVQK